MGSVGVKIKIDFGNFISNFEGGEWRVWKYVSPHTYRYCCFNAATVQVQWNFFYFLTKYFNPFIRNASFLYPPEILMDFCFQGVEKVFNGLNIFALLEFCSSSTSKPDCPSFLGRLKWCPLQVVVRFIEILIQQIILLRFNSI